MYPAMPLAWMKPCRLEVSVEDSEKTPGRRVKGDALVLISHDERAKASITLL